MVTEPNALSDRGSEATSDDGLPPLEVVDSTPPDVLAQEEAFMAGDDVSEQDAVQDDAGTQAEAAGTDETLPDTDEPPAQPSLQTEQQESPSEVESEPPPRQYTQDEVSKIQSTYARQIAEQDKRLKELETRARERDVENQVEAELRRQEQSLAQQVGAEEAQRMVRDQQNVQSVRDAAQARSEAQQLRAERDQYAQHSRIAAMNTWVSQLQQQYKLSETDVQSLAGLAATAGSVDDATYVQIGEQIGGLAARLGATAEQRAVASEERRNIVPRETPQTALESGQSISPAPPSRDSLLQSAQNKLASDWTVEEARAMRDAAGV